MAQFIPEGINKRILEQAIDLLENGYFHQFSKSTDYDVVFNGKRYSPKAVVGIASELVSNRKFKPRDFKGGRGTPCFKVLLENGFNIENKKREKIFTVKSEKIKQIFGAIQGINEGDWFINKKALRESGLHRMERHGIDGSNLGASSIVLNAGYSDDYDLGTEILYTGHGGNDDQTKVQIADQSWTSIGNRALLISEQRNIPVRVIRGSIHDPSIKNGYVYGGLYLVTGHKMEIGKAGFKVCRFHLEKVDTLIDGNNNMHFNPGNKEPGRRILTSLNIIRDQNLADQVKKLHNYTCQICGTKLMVGNISYAEAAHIRPLGRPHNGADVSDNLLCLCPNHHALFDLGGISIESNFNLIGLKGRLNLNKKHFIEEKNLDYHRKHIWINLF